MVKVNRSSEKTFDLISLGQKSQSHKKYTNSRFKMINVKDMTHGKATKKAGGLNMEPVVKGYGTLNNQPPA